MTIMEQSIFSKMDCPCEIIRIIGPSLSQIWLKLSTGIRNEKTTVKERKDKA